MIHLPIPHSSSRSQGVRWGKSPSINGGFAATGPSCEALPPFRACGSGGEAAQGGPAAMLPCDGVNLDLEDGVGSARRK